MADVPCDSVLTRSVLEVSYPGPGAKATTLNRTNFQTQKTVTRRCASCQQVKVLRWKSALSCRLPRNIEHSKELQMAIILDKSLFSGRCYKSKILRLSWGRTVGYIRQRYVRRLNLGGSAPPKWKALSTEFYIIVKDLPVRSASRKEDRKALTRAPISN